MLYTLHECTDLEMMPVILPKLEKRGSIYLVVNERLSIARAVYADADVYLFDDPLSAL